MTGGERWAAAGVVGLVGVLGVIGAVNSFTHVAEAVRPSFGDLAPTVPLGVDVGIAAFTGLDLLMARLGMRTRWLRLVPWALVGTTVYLNVAGETTVVGQVAHGVLPLLWVVAVEAGAHVVRVFAGLSGKGAPRMDRIRFSRWVLAPLPTLLLWRRMVLWEVRSYPEALTREQDRLLARCDLQDATDSTVAWRWRAPRRQRVLYRLGRLAPAELAPADPQPVARVVEVRSNGNGDHAADLIAQDMARNGERVTRRTLVAAARAAKVPLGTNKAAEIAARYQ